METQKAPADDAVKTPREVGKSGLGSAVTWYLGGDHEVDSARSHITNGQVGNTGAPGLQAADCGRLFGQCRRLRLWEVIAWQEERPQVKPRQSLGPSSAILGE